MTYCVGLLVDRGLAACVNILPGMTSIYIWDGKRQRDAEAAMLIKTRTSLADTAIAACYGPRELTVAEVCRH